MEKLIKMTNPNYKLSPTRILLKYVNKKLSAEQMRVWVYSLFENLMTPKKLKTVKLLKDIKILTENEIPKGFVFLEFVTAERAMHFIKTAVERKDDTIEEIGNARGDTPIIEFAFDDVKKLRKIEDIKKKQKEGVKQTAHVEVAEKETIDKKKFQKELQGNRKLMAKKLVSDCLQQNSEDLAKQAVETINSLKSRGLKHRLFKKLEKRFSHLLPYTQKEEAKAVEKIQKPAERKKKIEKVKVKTPPKIDEDLVKIKQEVKNKNKKLRREKNQVIDKPDEFETKFIKNVQKKAKWSETS